VNSYLVYRASFYLMLVVATMAASGDGQDGPFGRLYTLAVVVAGIVAFVTVDRQRQWALPRPVANTMAVGTLVILYFEYRVDDTQMIQALGHWLVYLQLIKYFLPKTAEDDWFLFLLGLMQVMIGSVISQSDYVGTWLFAWAMLAVWVLGQFFLQREVHRLVPQQSAMPGPELGATAVDPYRGLFDLPYAVATARVMLTTLALGSLIFLLLPRQPGTTRSQSGAQMSRHLTGFDEEVQLGQLGEILENDSVVMTVELSDEDGKPMRPAGEPLWRGVTMLKYENKKWHRPPKPTQLVVSVQPQPVGISRKVIRQKIKLEPNDSSTVFAIRPVLFFDATHPNAAPPGLSANDGTLVRQDRRGGDYDYVVVSDADPETPQPSELPPAASDESLLKMPPGLPERLRKIAGPVVAGITAQGQEGTRTRALALERHLRESGLYSYTLQMDVVDSRLDPVEDFLVNRKKGHCEYFASALALLLRSIGIPSRVVNGFKGGDWNELTETLNVRQKHAHSWVEAYLGKGPNSKPRWITLDPTPAQERQESIAHVGGLATTFRPLTDTVRHVWVYYIVGYDGERQNRLLYGPMKMMLTEVKKQYVELGNQLRRWFHFPDLSSFVSIRGFVVTFLALTLLAGVVHVVYRLVLRLLALLRGPALDPSSLTAGILFYRRLTQMLAEIELERTPAETQSEFALRAQKLLNRQGPFTQDVADVPQQVVDAFYRVRFGHLELAPESLEQLDGRLDALEASLKNPS
jgi:protein-glutamine gamma-glutamyltransferase